MTEPPNTHATSERTSPAPPCIGLALSGGGFRASIFHLGVIRRLEELGLMEHVHTISAVSGGSIIAAYYAVEMEKRLRRHRKMLQGKPRKIDCIRLQIFEDIACCFFKALDHNLRSRALVFGPFYHPILFLKSLLTFRSRSDIMHREYDRWFYHGDTLDQLPAVTNGDASGPSVVLNATSLLSGKRTEFTRESVSGLRELHRVNRNTLRLSTTVGASSGMPGVFPPTTISGDRLVDGGVSDNQGIDALIHLDRLLDGDGNATTDFDRFDTLLVSDASGQMEVIPRVGNRILSVMRRVISIFQFQLRRKTIRILRLWKRRGADRREFAFVHLLLNLKGRSSAPPRVPSEYIPALAAIRTDMDQFGFIEREALMYHGYTLIEAQIQKHCGKLTAFIRREKGDLPRLTPPPPLFVDRSDSDPATQQCVGETAVRKRVKDVLTAGANRWFLSRSRQKYPWKSWLIFIPALILLLLGTKVTPHDLEPLQELTSQLARGFSCAMPDVTQCIWEKLVGTSCCLEEVTHVLTVVVWYAAWGYFVAFLTYGSMRRFVRRWDLMEYESLAGMSPTARWPRRGGAPRGGEDMAER